MGVALCSVVSVAMPNCNPHMRDCPVDVPEDASEYTDLLRDKCRALCTAAVKSGATVLVVPDCGCGVYGNNPGAIGSALGSILGQEFSRSFVEVHLVGTSDFTAAVQESFSKPSKQMERFVDKLEGVVDKVSDKVEDAMDKVDRAVKTPGFEDARDKVDSVVEGVEKAARKGVLKAASLAAHLDEMRDRR